MTERSFFDFGSQPDDFNRIDPSLWGGRFQKLNKTDGSADEKIIEATFEEDTLPTHGEIIELIETLHSGEASPFVQRPATNRAHAVHLPDHYEARYAYPLIVWFHGDGSSEKELSAVIPNISDRNFIGLALRGNTVDNTGYSWSSSDEQLDDLIEDVESLVRMMRRQYHVHSERIYLAGFASGASTAMQLMLRKPEWFGAAACLCGSFSQIQIPSFRFHELRNKRLLLTSSGNNRSNGVRAIVATGRLLYASGMQIATRFYQDVGLGPSRKMLSDLNHWLMVDVCSATA